MKSESRTIAAALILGSGLLCVPRAAASAITGGISFNGTALLNDQIPNAYAFLSFTDGTVAKSTTSGSFAGMAGIAVDFQPFQFLTAAGGTASLGTKPVTVWSFSNNGTTYSLTLDKIVAVREGPLGDIEFLNISGTGIAHIDGLTDTPETFNITAIGNNQELSFLALSTVVPDGGPSLLMLGSALIGISVLRRSVSK